MLFCFRKRRHRFLSGPNRWRALRFFRWCRLRPLLPPPRCLRCTRAAAGEEEEGRPLCSPSHPNHHTFSAAAVVMHAMLVMCWPLASTQTLWLIAAAVEALLRTINYCSASKKLSRRGKPQRPRRHNNSSCLMLMGKALPHWAEAPTTGGPSATASLAPLLLPQREGVRRRAAKKPLLLQTPPRPRQQRRRQGPRPQKSPPLRLQSCAASRPHRPLRSSAMPLIIRKTSSALSMVFWSALWRRHAGTLSLLPATICWRRWKSPPRRTRKHLRCLSKLQVMPATAMGKRRLPANLSSISNSNKSSLPHRPHRPRRCGKPSRPSSPSLASTALGITWTR